MNQVYIKTKDCSETISDYYKERDLVSIETIISDLEDFIYREEERKRKELEDERDKNWGVSEYDDFIYESLAGK